MNRHADLPDAGLHTHFDIDLQLPEPNQKDALAGTVGTPSADNEFVTADQFDQGLKQADSPTFAGITTGNIELGYSNLKGIDHVIPDDDFSSWTPGRSIGVVIINARGATYKQWVAIISYRTVATHFTQSIIAPGSWTMTTGALTGTTGVDGDLTFSANSADGKLYLENRTGGAISLSVVHLGL